MSRPAAASPMGRAASVTPNGTRRAVAASRAPILLALAMLPLTATVATAQAAAAPAVAASAPAASPAKKALVKRVLQLQEAGFESIARGLIEQPAAAILQQVHRTLQTSVAVEKRDAIGQEAQADVRKFVDEMVPPITKRALEIAPGVIGPLLEERFSEDELRQLAAFLDSPVSRKYQQVGGELQKALGGALIEAARPLVEPRMRALESTLMKRLGLTEAGAQPAAAARRAPAEPAKK